MTARKRRKAKAKAKVTLPGGTVIPQTAANDPGRERPEDARRGPLEARKRVSGMEGTPEAFQWPAFGDDIGLCIIALIRETEPDAKQHPAKVQALWETWCRMTAARRLWRMLYIGQTGDPQNAAVAMQSDAMIVDPSLRVDLRTPEERIQAAIRGELYWRERIACVKVPQLQMALRSAVDGFNGPFWRNGKPTQAGAWAAKALQVINDQVTDRGA